MIEKRTCEVCGYESHKHVKWRVQWKKFLCFMDHCEYDKPSEKLLEYRILNWKH